MAKKQTVIDYKPMGIGQCVVLHLPNQADAMRFFEKEILAKMPTSGCVTFVRILANPENPEVRFSWQKSQDHDHINALLNRIRIKFPTTEIAFEKMVTIRPKKK